MQTKDIIQGEVYAVYTGYSVPQNALYRTSSYDVERMKVLVTNVSFSADSGWAYPLDMDAVVKHGVEQRPRIGGYRRRSIKNGVLVEFMQDSRSWDPNDRTKPQYRKGDRIVVKPQRILELHSEFVERKRVEKERREEWDREREQKKQRNIATAKRVNERVKRLGLTDPNTVGRPLNFEAYPDGSVQSITLSAEAFEKLLDQIEGVTA